MAVMAQTSVAAVHLNEARAQVAAMVTASIVLVIGLIAAHEAPFRSASGRLRSPSYSTSCRIVKVPLAFRNEHPPLDRLAPVRMALYTASRQPLGLRFNWGAGTRLQAVDRFL
jgi:hypothetical protein